MCTQYNLQDNPEIFKQFIPRNLSYTELSSNSFESKFAWCLIPNEVFDCECKFPKLSKLFHNRMGRRDLFDQQINFLKPTILKDSKCCMCEGSLSYFPSDLKIVNCDRRSRSELNEKSKNRKSVRFADALGLQLTEVKLITETDSTKAPTLSSSAIKDLHLDHNYHLSMQGTKYFFPCFKIQLDEETLQQRTIENHISLEDAYIEGMTLLGRILVRNVCFEKNVGVRISFNNWTSFKDIYASYILESSNGIIDKFSFSIVIPQYIIVNSKIEFSVFYLTQDGQTFWDNNSNQNYAFECFAKNMGIVTDDGWLHFL